MRSILVLLALLLAPATASAQTTGSPTTQEIGKVIFSEVEKRAIEEFFGKKAASREADEAGDDEDGDKGRGHKKDKGHKKEGKGRGDGLPPGLAKRDRLPPGLERKVARGEGLPPGLQRGDLPEDLARRLPPPAAGTERTVVGGDVVLIEKATDTVLDILYDVVVGKAGAK